MASPTPIPPLRPRPPRSFAGPVVLIVMGVVFLLTTMGVIHWEMLGPLFARYWPLLLILWGVIKLVEYQQAQRSGMRASGIGVGGVFLIIVVIFVGLAATGLARINWDAIRGEMDMGDNDFPWFGHTYGYDDQVEQDFPAGATLRVNNERGAINLNVADGNKIRVSVHKRINASSQGEADRKNERTKLQIATSGSVVTLDAKVEGGSDRFDMDISLPRKAAVVISNRRGDVSILGRDGDVEVSSQKGDVSLADINGKAVLKLERSSARLSQISGDVSMDGRMDDISLEDIKGMVRMSGEFGEGASVRLSRLAKSVSLKSSRTELELAKLDGDLDLDAHDLDAKSLTGPVRILTKFKDIRLDGVSGDLRLTNDSGAVEVRMLRLGSLQVDNKQGDINIYVPDKAGFQVDARARNGEFESDFRSLSVSDQDDVAKASGTVGSGGPRMVVNNEHGKIEIRKRSTLAEIPTPPRPPKSPEAPDGPELSDN